MGPQKIFEGATARAGGVLYSAVTASGAAGAPAATAHSGRFPLFVCNAKPAAAGHELRYGVTRLQENGPKLVGEAAARARGSMRSFSHSSGVVLPWTVIRWKFFTA